MRARESMQLYESDMALGPTTNSQILLRGDDIHRAASGGTSVLLRPKRGDMTGAIRISQYTGEEITIRANDPLSRRPVARGGLLCDDPGLGKTVTVISLILQTLGLSTEKSKREEEETADDADECIFNEYWNEQFVPEFRRLFLKIVFL